MADGGEGGAPAAQVGGGSVPAAQAQLGSGGAVPVAPVGGGAAPAVQAQLGSGGAVPVAPVGGGAAPAVQAQVGGGGGAAPTAHMHEDLLEAATFGCYRSLHAMISQEDISILFGQTPYGNNCLHISSMQGHWEFPLAALALEHARAPEKSLLSETNLDGETPLVVAVRSGSVMVASALLRWCRDAGLRDAILKQDNDGCNALHHAIRCGHRALALELIAAEPHLSTHVNKYNESAMFAAAMRDYGDVVQQLLGIPASLDVGQFGCNALHAAVRNGNAGIAGIIVGARPELARQFHNDAYTPVCMAVDRNMIDMLRVFLQHDSSLGYEKTSDGYTLLQIAAYEGHVDIARELLKHCPDAPCRRTHADGWTCLHTAVLYGYADFVKFILSMPQLRKVINMQNKDGKTALHLAVEKCNPKIVEALLSHQDTDATVLNNRGTAPVWVLSSLSIRNRAKTLNWNQVLSLIQRADPRGAPSINNLRMHMSRLATDESRNNAKLLTQRYMTNTSLVAILITTVTFAAAFTLPGGYSSEGLPNMSRKVAFKAFLISDTLATCSSFVVAFACIIARWEDYEFLIYYKSITEYIMWFAYMATTTAFSTGLYTVLAPHTHWLVILISVLVASFPIITWLVVKLPVLKLRYQLGQTFNSNLLDMV